jgi:hypothetical protein
VDILQGGGCWDVEGRFGLWFGHGVLRFGEVVWRHRQKRATAESIAPGQFFSSTCNIFHLKGIRSDKEA